MSAERDAALDEFFSEPTGRSRTAGDAVALASEAMEPVVERLEIAGELGDGAEPGAEGDADLQIRHAAISLGKTCVDALAGLVISGEVTDSVAPRRDAMDELAPPLDDAWQKVHNPYMALTEIASKQGERLAGLRDQPNQVFRHLHETVALAADIAAWTAWTQLEASPGADD